MVAAKRVHQFFVSQRTPLIIELFFAELVELWRRFRVGLAAFPGRFKVPAWAVMLAGCSVLALTQAMIAILISEAELSLVLVTSLAPFLLFVFYPALFPGDLAKLHLSWAGTGARVVALKSLLLENGAAVGEARRREAEAKRIYEGVLKAGEPSAGVASGEEPLPPT